LREVRHPGFELGSQDGGLGLADVRASRLRPRPVGGRATGLPAPPDEDPRAARPRAGTAGTQVEVAYTADYVFFKATGS
jgi:hypothetical protein